MRRTQFVTHPGPLTPLDLVMRILVASGMASLTIVGAMILAYSI